MDAVADRTVDPGSSGVVPFRFACHRCGPGCSGGSGDIWIEAHDVERMAGVLGATDERFMQRFVREARPMDETFATALEVDHALAKVANRAGKWRLGNRRTVACRYRSVASGAEADDNVGVSHTERTLRDVSDIERACGYPPAYSALADLLRAGGANVGDVT